MNKITANLLVDRIEDVLPFYEAFGFTRTVEMPHADSLGFVILNHGDVELMMESRPALAADIAPLAKGSYRAMLYIEVDALAPIRKTVTKLRAKAVVPERTTSYGAREIIVEDPAGNIVAFASHEK